MCNGRKARIQVKRSLNFKGCHGHARGDPLFTNAIIPSDIPIPPKPINEINDSTAKICANSIATHPSLQHNPNPMYQSIYGTKSPVPPTIIDQTANLCIRFFVVGDPLESDDSCAFISTPFVS